MSWRDGELLGRLGKASLKRSSLDKKKMRGTSSSHLGGNSRQRGKYNTMAGQCLVHFRNSSVASMPGAERWGSNQRVQRGNAYGEGWSGGRLYRTL